MTKFLFLSICVMFTKKIHMTKIIGLRCWSKLQKALYNIIGPKMEFQIHLKTIISMGGECIPNTLSD